MPDPLYEVKVVAQDGTSFGVAENAKVNRVSWELNGIGAAEISLATTDSDAALFLPGREVQIRHQGDLIWWGPIIRPQVGLDETTWQCAGLLWYFAHRFMGRADRQNQLSNGDFEDGETDWSFFGVTHSVNTDLSYVVEGSKSLKLTGATADHATFASQTWTHPAGGYPTGDFITGSVWVYVPADEYLGGALEDFGLVLRHDDGDGNTIATGVVTIDDDTEKDAWVQLETGVANVLPDHTVTAMLFPPHGDAYFDLATLTFMESLSFGYPPPGVDVTDIIAGIVDYAQDHSGFGHGKSDLFIYPGGTDTGVLRQVAYQFEEHRNILDAILEFVRDGVCDIDIDWPGEVRTFRVYPDRKGGLYDPPLELDVNIADFTWASDLEQSASSVILVGPGDGPDRPEGGAVDTSFAGGAFTAEIVERAPDNTTIGQLDQRAEERLKVAARPQLLTVTTLPGAGVLGNLTVGDRVPVVVSHGWIDIDATYRVAAVEANLSTDQVTFTLNAEVE